MSARRAKPKVHVPVFWTQEEMDELQRVRDVWHSAYELEASRAAFVRLAAKEGLRVLEARAAEELRRKACREDGSE